MHVNQFFVIFKSAFEQDTHEREGSFPTTGVTFVAFSICLPIKVPSWLFFTEARELSKKTGKLGAIAKLVG